MHIAALSLSLLVAAAIPPPLAPTAATLARLLRFSTLLPTQTSQLASRFELKPKLWRW